MQVDALGMRLRPRTPMEAADLGIELCRHTARSVYTCYAIVALPVVAIALASVQLGAWLPALTIWCAKPWLDRTVLFVLSRAAFGKNTVPADIWESKGQVLWRQWLFTCTVQRLSPWRSLTEPVYQLEGASVFRAGPRIRQIRYRNAWQAFMFTHAFSVAELSLTLALASLAFWLALPSGRAPDLMAAVSGERSVGLWLVMPVSYAVTVLFLEPFYVASGFAMYLNRRAELEAWDIEQEFRRAFAA